MRPERGGCLGDGEGAAADQAGDQLPPDVKALALGDRALLWSLHLGGASLCQLARLTGLSRSGVRKRIRRARDRAQDGEQLLLARHWRVLSAEEQRLVRLVRVEGLSYREIARRRLVTHVWGGGERPVSTATLARWMRRIMSKVARAESRRRLRGGEGRGGGRP